MVHFNNSDIFIWSCVTVLYMSFRYFYLELRYSSIHEFQLFLFLVALQFYTWVSDNFWTVCVVQLKICHIILILKVKYKYWLKKKYFKCQSTLINLWQKEKKQNFFRNHPSKNISQIFNKKNFLLLDACYALSPSVIIYWKTHGDYICIAGIPPYPAARGDQAARGPLPPHPPQAAHTAPLHQWAGRAQVHIVCGHSHHSWFSIVYCSISTYLKTTYILCICRGV